MIPANEALVRLRDGNRAFAAGLQLERRVPSPSRRAELVGGQEPFATILGCSDSRVPAEIVFNQGLGDLFVIRVAGNVVAPSLVGSVEFAAHKLGCRLVVVLGHTDCGAVHATVEALEAPGSSMSRNLYSFVERIRPSVEALLATDLRDDRDALIHQAVRANVHASVNHLRHGSEMLESLIADQGVRVVGAEYSLQTGLVDFFELGDLA